ncbi:MAG: SpoIIE family protein phosphatase [Candidatus Coproplasma sp.]
MPALYNAVMALKLTLKSVLLYSAYALTTVALNSVASKVPLSLGVCFSMLICGTNAVITPVIYVLASIISLDWITMLLSLFEAGFLTLIVFLYRRTGRKIRAEAAAYAVIALGPFVAFSNWGNGGGYVLDNPFILRGIAAGVCVAFLFFAFRTVYALLFRLCRCRLKGDELLCIAVLFAVAGVGVRSLIGVYAYLCLCALITAFSVRLTKNASCTLVALVASLPLTIVSLDLNFITASVVIAVITLLFCPLGRFAPSIVTMVLTALHLYLLGCFNASAVIIVAYSLLLFVLCLIAALPSEKRVENLRSLLTLQRVLPRTEEVRCREELSEKLYRMSDVFREISCAFNALDDGPDDAAMKKRMLTETKQRACSSCPKKETCKSSGVYKGFASLIESGCLKGKVGFIDLTADVTRNCKNPSDLIEIVNKLLYEYRKATLEAENAKNGRRLLAEQASGVAQALKSRAVEFCRESDDYSALEKKLSSALSANGITCPELKIVGNGTKQVFLTLVGNYDFLAVKSCVEDTLGEKFMLKNKIVYNNEKSAYVLAKPPKYDAAFGVAYAIKSGEKVSGDTHSVIKIDEHSFLMALSDGMGSGEYAGRVSATAISLIEAFSRSQMPQDVMLDTINKLLCFNRDERFTCIDAATVDLNTLSASFVKIGSPVGLIVRKGEIKVLESNSLPLGILDSLHPATSREQLKKNDIIVFMSDGITSCFDGTAQLYEFIGKLKPLNPQALADDILAEAKKRVLGTPDDMTVLCVRVYEKGNK